MPAAVPMIKKWARQSLPVRWHYALRHMVRSEEAPDELKLIQLAVSSIRNGVMIDVGAHYGTTSSPFLDKGWKVVGFEPDSKNRAILTRDYGKHPNFTMDSRAVSNHENPALTLYRSDVSSGISSLEGFHPSHTAAETVCVTTLNKALTEHKVDKIDVLKVDTEGYDLFVLQGLDMSRIPVRVVMTEFEERKTKSLGYTPTDLVNYLVAQGFKVVISIWEPITEYGHQHKWRSFSPYPCEIDPLCWGNVLGFYKEDDRIEFLRLASKYKWYQA